MTAPFLLRGVDLAAFAVALVARLRRGGVAVAASGPDACSCRRCVHWRRGPRTGAVLGGAAHAGESRAEDLRRLRRGLRCGVRRCRCWAWTRRARSAAAAVPPDAVGARRAGRSAAHRATAGGLPWVTRRSATAPDRPTTGAWRFPTCCRAASSRAPTSRSSGSTRSDLRLLGAWLEQATDAWPQRRSMRRELQPHGKRIDLRETMKASRSHRLGDGACSRAPGAGAVRAASCWSATSAGRCSPTRRSTCT